MIRIENDALYSREDLATMLKPAGVDVDYFIARLRPRKVFRMVWLGEDILTALRAAPALSEPEEAGAPEPAAVAQGARRGRRGRPALDDPSAALRRLRERLR